MYKFKDIAKSWNNANGCEVLYGNSEELCTEEFYIDGCCQSIIHRMKEYRWFKVYVLKQTADTTLSSIGISLEDYLQEIVDIGFPAVHNVNVVQRASDYNYPTLNLIDKYEFTIDNTALTKHSYYLFCWIRHLYYKQNVPINYFHYKKEWEVSTLKDKINLLAFIGGLSGGHTVLIKNQSTIIKEDTIQRLASFEYNNSNSNFIEPNKTSLRSFAFNHYVFIKNYEEAEKFFLSELDKIPAITRTSSHSNTWDYFINSEKYVKSPNGRIYARPIESIYFSDLGNISLTTPYTLKQANMEYVKVLSRHPSHKVFRKNEALKFPTNVLIRLGSTTDIDESKYQVKINSIPSIQRSSNKLLMKQCFDQAQIPTPQWTPNIEEAKTFTFPIVAKHLFGSRNSGNYKIDSVEQLTKWAKNRNLENYLYEKFEPTQKEYRIHVSTEGVFLAWRKLRKLETPDDQKWFFNNQNCNWAGESNEWFDTPKNWGNICQAAQAALNSVGLTIGAIDVRVQSNERKNPKFFILETNSGASQASVTTEAYIQEITKIVNKTI